MKTAVVCGASGLIGQHLVPYLKERGYHVTGISRTLPQYYFGPSADKYFQLDLREYHGSFFNDVDVVFQLACEVGGLGYIMDKSNDSDCLRNSTLIDLNVLEGCRRGKVGKVFFASSACVYPVLNRPLKETDAYPAVPLNAFAWQKLFAERLYQSYASNYGMHIRIGRLFNTYGPGMTWTGGREKSVAAICRKVAELEPGKKLEVWGDDGSQERSYTFVTDTVEGIYRLMQSDCSTPLNIGSEENYSIRQLVNHVREVSGKVFETSYVSGPIGNPSIVCDSALMKRKLQWEPQIGLLEGLKHAYPWVAAQVLDREQQA